MSTVFSKVLGQAAPADTTAVALYTKSQDAIAKLGKLMICNTTGTNATCRVFVDDDGATYVAANAILYDKVVPLNDTIEVDFDGGTLFTASGTVGIRTGTNDALTFTLFGEEIFQ
jgi:hypothetical protein